MYGLVNRSIQLFMQETYGEAAWRAVADTVGAGQDGFEALLEYDDAITVALIEEMARLLDKPVEMVLEDIGTFVVSHASFERLRRLLRFGGETFVDFLYSLEELQGRAHLALPELNAPQLELTEEAAGRFSLRCAWQVPGACHVVMGILRAMADDYGALVLLDYAQGKGACGGLVRVELLDSRFAAGRDFKLAVMAE